MNNVFITTSGEEIPIIFEARRGLCNITIRPRVMPRREIRISVPRLASQNRALRFVDEKRRWLERIFAAAPQKAAVHDGDRITLFGRPVLIRHDPSGRAGVYMEGGNEYGVTPPAKGGGAPRTKQDILFSIMVVCGPVEMLERRVRDEIKRQFLARVSAEIVAVVRKHPELRPSKITVRDTTSRWGSCSSTRSVSFSYRLAFAPYEVMRYVILHELAHLKHMDHSPRFWATVGQLYGPGYEGAKRWLSRNGQSLHQLF